MILAEPEPVPVRGPGLGRLVPELDMERLERLERLEDLELLEPGPGFGPGDPGRDRVSSELTVGGGGL